MQEVVEQLSECLKQNGDHVNTPANLWLNDLVQAYVSHLQAGTYESLLGADFLSSRFLTAIFSQQSRLQPSFHTCGIGLQAVIQVNNQFPPQHLLLNVWTQKRGFPIVGAKEQLLVLEHCFLEPTHSTSI